MSRYARSAGITRLGNALLNLSALPGRYGSALIFVLVIVVVLSVLGAQFSLGELLRWETRVPLFGNHLSMTSIAELQWHVFSLLVMLAGAYALKEDRHIRVDVVSASFSDRTRIWIDILGDLFFLLPFFAVLGWFSVSFVQTSYNFGEQSNVGGLVDRYLVKAVLPIGSALLLLAGFGRVLRNIGLLIEGRVHDEVEGNES